jgi:hypothetical protein
MHNDRISKSFPFENMGHIVTDRPLMSTLDSDRVRRDMALKAAPNSTESSSRAAGLRIYHLNRPKIGHFPWYFPDSEAAASWDRDSDDAAGPRRPQFPGRI